MEEKHLSGAERVRAADLMGLLSGSRGGSVLDVGARDGRISYLLTDHFETVTALDLNKPSIDHPRVSCVKGDATQLAYADRSFDCVVCTEVLEHIPDVVRAAHELARVARHEILIGVPYQQDIRVGRVTCRQCGAISAPWGHLHTFDERVIAELFPQWQVAAKSYVGKTREATTALAAWLMDVGGNPWGTYNQQEPCPYCSATLLAPGRRPLWQRVSTAIAARMNRIQARYLRSRAAWLHMLLRRN